MRGVNAPVQDADQAASKSGLDRILEGDVPTRRNLLIALGAAGGVAALGAGGVASTYWRDMTRIREELAAQKSTVIDTSFGALEYAEAGEGAPLMMIHGTGGGFDQGLLFAGQLVDAGYRVIAPSRFGYLKSDFPDDPSSENQADALVELLDHLGI